MSFIAVFVLQTNPLKATCGIQLLSSLFSLINNPTPFSHGLDFFKTGSSSGYSYNAYPDLTILSFSCSSSHLNFL